MGPRNEASVQHLLAIIASRAAYRVMVAIVFDYRNLFDILKSINFVENCVWLPLCLGPRMHEGQNRVPGSI